MNTLTSIEVARWRGLVEAWRRWSMIRSVRQASEVRRAAVLAYKTPCARRDEAYMKAARALCELGRVWDRIGPAERNIAWPEVEPKLAQLEEPLPPRSATIVALEPRTVPPGEAASPPYYLRE